MNTFLENRSFIKEARSGAVMDNVQELLDASVSAKQDTLANQNQYFTPTSLWTYCKGFMRNQRPMTALDPQCGKGQLLEYDWGVNKFGIELDNRIEHLGPVKLLTGNCVRIGELIDELFPDLSFTAINTNNPFGKLWKRGDGSQVDSTVWTWEFALKRGQSGVFIANRTTMEKLGIDKHPWVYKYETKADVWPGVEVVIGIAWWERPKDTNRPRVHTTPPYEIEAAWKIMAEILNEEKAQRPPFNIWIDKRGYLRTYLSVRDQVIIDRAK